MAWPLETTPELKLLTIDERMMSTLAVPEGPPLACSPVAFPAIMLSDTLPGIAAVPPLPSALKPMTLFWTTVARGAAQTQGVAIPAIKKPKAAFGSLHLACGDTDVTPIHPFRIGHRVDDGTSADEGFYVFPPSAISPQCAAVKITVFSDKPSDKGDTRTVDAKIVQQVWDDFAPYREATGSTGPTRRTR